MAGGCIVGNPSPSLDAAASGFPEGHSRLVVWQPGTNGKSHRSTCQGAVNGEDYPRLAHSTTVLPAFGSQIKVHAAMWNAFTKSG